MRGREWSAFAGGVVAGGVLVLASACSSAAKASPGAVRPPAPEPVPVAAPALTTPPAAEVSAQVRSTRSACATEAARQQLEVVDFVTFNRLDDNNWDTTIRARRTGRLVRVGCRYDLRAGWTHIYEPAAADGGNPWGPGGPPAVARDAGKDAAKEPPKAAPKPGASPASKPAARPPAGAGINLASVADTSARAAIGRTREACLAEAARRKIAVDDFEAFRRVEGSVWEAMLVVNKARTTRSCRLDLSSGKATIK